MSGIDFFARAAQRGRVRRTNLRFDELLATVGAQIHFFFGVDDFLAIHLHALEAHDFVADQADKIHILRRLAIDPLFVFDFAVFFANFLGRTALGGHHHFTIHAHQNLVRLDRVSELGRKSVEVGLRGRIWR